MLGDRRFVGFLRSSTSIRKRRNVMGDKSPKNTQKQKAVHNKKKEDQKKKPAQPSAVKK
jgi:hypothetical protein